MDAGPRIEDYEWRGGREAMLRFGPANGSVVVVALPLFEEANRTRALTVAVARLLAGRGIATALPDLPGQGESVASLTTVRLADWRAAFAAAAVAAGERSHVVALRGGALVDADAPAERRLHIAPAAGKHLVRDLLRARRAAALAAAERPIADDIDAPGPPLLLSGNLLDRDLLRDLMAAEPRRADRTVALFPDGGPADRLLAPAERPNDGGDLPRFRKPWAIAEPMADPVLAKALAVDIADWIAICGG